MPKPQKNPSGHLTTEDYYIIWRPPASKGNGYAPIASENSIETNTMVDEHIDDETFVPPPYKHFNILQNLPNLGESLVDNALNSQDIMFEERGDWIENIWHHSDTKHHDLSLMRNLSSNLPPESTPKNNTLGKRKALNSLKLNPESHKQGPKSTLASSYAELYEFNIEEYDIKKLDWEQQKWHLEKEQKDKEQHMELTIREKKLQFTNDGKDKELEVRMLMADKDCEAMEIKENNALLCAVVGSSRSVQEICKIFK
ncbi:hypothetical protein PPACK8108_LOCUS22903 [Phakopsora pachyrhizi]|uniref:Uncharacterized protein n=1 Tax=Phakopsora pachyrhizi TaxID=170000 RepID=A0AAV0BL86_PHAPC|nr:hypothetical protein PPACK8108_LOCUS22903 [Phakopsora pachyrhizi]